MGHTLTLFLKVKHEDISERSIYVLFKFHSLLRLPFKLAECDRQRGNNWKHQERLPIIAIVSNYVTKTTLALHSYTTTDYSKTLHFKWLEQIILNKSRGTQSLYNKFNKIHTQVQKKTDDRCSREQKKLISLILTLKKHLITSSSFEK